MLHSLELNADGTVLGEAIAVPLNARMSAWGQSRRFDRAPLTSGLPRLADILRVIRHVSKVPKNEPAHAGGAGGAVKRLRLQQ
jgi:hypothetical protein